MSPIVALDVSLLAIPSVADSTASVEELLKSVNEWATAIENQNAAVLLFPRRR
jgi:hypothetical protein